MKIPVIVLTTAAVFAFGPLSTAADLAEVKSDLALVQSEIQVAQAEDERYSGGLVKALIESRVEVLRQTEAMLQQKLLSIKTGTSVRYTVDGKTFSLPATAHQLLGEIENAINESETKIQAQEAEVARFSGGLVQAMALSTLETMRQTHAMLEQKRVSLKYGLPQYVEFADARAGAKLPTSTLSDASQTAAVRPSPAGDEIQQKAIRLSVIDKGFIDADPSASRYQGLMTFECSYENTSEKDIRAFTGDIVFQDLFGKEIFRSSITISDPIQAGQRATWAGTVKYNQFMDSHQRLRATELRDMNVVWLPSSIIFSDGTRIGNGLTKTAPNKPATSDSPLPPKVAQPAPDPTKPRIVGLDPQ
jgi:hypothetical protein